MFVNTIRFAGLMCTLSLLATPVSAAPRLLDVNFAKAICDGWNKTSLPTKVGRSGSGWIDSANSKGKQVLVVNRRDCSDWKPNRLVIEADNSGRAMCTNSGTFSGGKYQWKFEPTTEQWADFTDGFGFFKMPKIMKGFVGPYSTAMNNIGSFEVFFAMVGYTALKSDLDWQCVGADADDVVAAVADIDRGDMRGILKGMKILEK